MDHLRKSALIILLVQKLHEKDSWCGETHIQKAVYFLQSLGLVPFNNNFIMYKHGPFSFDLRSELTAMQADMMLELQPKLPYGPSVVSGKTSETILGNYKKTIKKYDTQISFIVDQFGSKGVRELERLATCLYVKLENNVNGSQELAKKVTALKPHISEEESLLDFEKVKKMIAESKKIHS